MTDRRKHHASAQYDHATGEQHGTAEANSTPGFSCSDFSPTEPIPFVPTLEGALIDCGLTPRAIVALRPGGCVVRGSL